MESHQFILEIGQEQMSLLKPLVRFESGTRAQLFPSSTLSLLSKEEESPEPKAKSFSVHSCKKSRNRKPKPKLLIEKGQLSLKVPGYKGKQKVQLSKLVQYLPIRKLQQAAKKALVASGVKGLPKKRKKTKTATSTHSTTLISDG